ncbi:MAG: NFACT family protein, partial [Nitrososphaerales archaeon]
MEKTEKARRASLSGLEVRVLVGELGRLSGGYLSDIHSLGEAQVLRVRKAGGEDSSVVVSPRYGAWITKRPAQTVTDEFTTSLRQTLLRLRIESVTQYDLDRVFIFRFVRGGAEASEGPGGGEAETKEREEVHLILELAPPGNIVVTDRDGRILLSLRELRGTQRTILRGKVYAPPPQTRGSPEDADEASLATAFASEKTAGRALGRGLSLPRRYVDEILARSSLGQDDPAPLAADTIARVARVVRELISSLSAPSPSLVRTGDSLELMAVAPATAEVVRGAATMSELVDETLGPMLLEDEASVVDDEDGRRTDQATREYEVTLERLEAQTAELGARAAGLREAALAVRGSASQEEVALALAAPQVGEALRAKVRPGAPPAAVSS